MAGTNEVSGGDPASGKVIGRFHSLVSLCGKESRLTVIMTFDSASRSKKVFKTTSHLPPGRIGGFKFDVLVMGRNSRRW
ncbi:hypothetical protein ACIQWQ_24550 [Peribacillus frigoritolerans]